MIRHLVLDIEAVVDGSLWTPPPEEPDQFAPAYAWRPICIGLVLLETASPGAVTVKRLGVLEETTERALLERFQEVVTRSSAELVTWNGRAYDLPALMLRSLRYGLVHSWYYRTKGMRYRFSEEGHLDLCDAMADYGAARRLHLDGMARLIGLPGKPKGADDVTGARVAEAYAAGRLHEIGSYCLADAVQTAFLWLRWQLIGGALTLPGYRAAAAALLDACDHNERLTTLVAGVDRRVLLLEGGEAEAAA